MKNTKNKKYGGKRLTKKIATEIRTLPEHKFMTQEELGKKYGVSREAINRILNNKTYKIKDLKE